MGWDPSQKRYLSGLLQMETSKVALVVNGGSVTMQLLVTSRPLTEALETAQEGRGSEMWKGGGVRCMLTWISECNN